MMGSNNLTHMTKQAPAALAGSLAVDDYLASQIRLPDISKEGHGRNWRKGVEK
jgi:hypothetical protein